MATPEVKNIVEDGLDLLIDFWKDKPVAQGLLKSQLTEIQKIRDIAFQLLNERSVYTAVGVQLDVIGSLVGEERQGKTDEPYRDAILTRISINRADGTPPVILDILNLLSGSEVPNIFEHFPASFHAYVDRGASHNLAKTLKDISAAGVDTRLIFDDGATSFIGARTLPSEELVTLEGSAFEVDSNPSYFTVEGDKIYPYENRSSLPHSKELALGIIKNPMAKTINATSFIVDIGVFDSGEDFIFSPEPGVIFEYTILEEI